MIAEKNNLNFKSIVTVAGVLAAVWFAWHQWSFADQLEKEDRLIFVGNQYRTAIGRYYENSPGPAKQYPRRLEDLVADGRLTPRATYIGELHSDPLGSESWGVVRDFEGGIIGIHSLSERFPAKAEDFGAGNEHFAGKSSHAEWVFKYVPDISGADRRSTFHQRRDEKTLVVREIADRYPNKNLESKNAGVMPVPAVSVSPFVRPLATQIDVATIALGMGVPGIPLLANETNRQRRVCIVNATRYASSCAHDPNNSASPDMVRVCVVEAQERYEQCNGRNR